MRHFPLLAAASLLALAVAVPPQSGDALALATFPFPVFSPKLGPTGPATLSYRTSTSSGTDGSSFTFSGVDIGTASSDRRVIVCIGWGNDAEQVVTSVTIAGITATQAVQTNTASRGAAIFYASVSSGTTGDVVITLDGTATRCGIAVYAGANMQSSTPVDSGSISQSGGSLTIADIEVKNDGFIICFTWATSNSNAITPVYNGVDSEVENVEAGVEAEHRLESWSCLTTEDATTNDPGSSTVASSTRSVVAASWR